MALIAQTNAPLTDVAGASDNSLNASYVGAVAVAGGTLAGVTAAAGAPAIAAIGGVALASGLAYAGYCDDADIDPLAPWGDDDASSKTTTPAAESSAA